MNENENLNDLFNPEIDLGNAATANLDDYKPTADKGKGGVYQAVIRFVPWYENPKKSIIEKWVAWLVDPVTERGRYVDCPSSVGKPSLLQDMYFKLKKSESIQDQKKADIFSRRHDFSSLIQVLKDDNQSDLEGKILVYRFGKKIWEKINAELKPVIGVPHNPFDILNGKVFSLVITKVSGFNNYDQSKFLAEIKPDVRTIPLCIPDADGKLIPIKPDIDKSVVFNYLKENSPNLNKYAFKEWDVETVDYVNHVITAIGHPVTSSNYAAVNETIHATPANQSQQSGDITSQDLNIGDLDQDLSSLNLDSIEIPKIPTDAPGLEGDLSEALGDL